LQLIFFLQKLKFISMQNSVRTDRIDEFKFIFISQSRLLFAIIYTYLMRLNIAK